MNERKYWAFPEPGASRLMNTALENHMDEWSQEIRDFIINRRKLREAQRRRRAARGFRPN